LEKCNLIFIDKTMLKGISLLIIPELLSSMARMGHRDEIVLVDAYFPGETFNALVVQYN
jgi:L-fucose mutarotase